MFLDDFWREASERVSAQRVQTRQPCRETSLVLSFYEAGPRATQGEGGGGGERKGERGDQERVRSRGEAGRGGGERRVAGARGAPDCGRGEEGLGVSWRPRHAREAFTAAASKGTLAPLPLTSAPLSPSPPPPACHSDNGLLAAPAAPVLACAQPAPRVRTPS